MNGFSIDKEKAAELLMDHYNATSAIVRSELRSRDRFFMYVLLVIAIIGVDACSPRSLSTLVNGYIETHILADGQTRSEKPAAGAQVAGENAGAPGAVAIAPTGPPAPRRPEQWQGLDFSAIDMLVRFLLLCLLISYYQKSIQVKRRFAYVGFLEREICKLMRADGDVCLISRDGKSYYSRTGDPTGRRGRPWYLLGVRPLYVWLLPPVVCFLAVCLAWPSVLFLLTVDVSFLYAKISEAFAGSFDVAYLKPVITAAISAACCLGMVFYSLMYLLWELFSR
jgi:hypothetical protein